MGPAPSVTRWFDAHLDLGYVAVCGRDMLAQDPAKAGGPGGPGAITFPSLREGGVAGVLGTIFVQPDAPEPQISYTPGDAASAHAAGVRQLELYARWREQGLIDFFSGTPRSGALRVGILIEGADAVTSPDELSWWKDRGVVAVGLAWSHAGRYAGGNGTNQGLTPAGHDLITHIDRLGLVHDLSHLSDVSLAELLALAKGRVMASHSNLRSLAMPGGEMPRAQRHLRDETVREIAKRGGMIGVNLFAPFLSPRSAPEGTRGTIADVVAHVERLCELAGDRRHVGLGSDADGGFPATRLPEGIHAPRDYRLLADALAAAGWSEGEIGDFAWGNWARFWGLV